MKLEKPFNSELLYNHIVHYYIDKKGITKQENFSVMFVKIVDVVTCLMTTLKIKIRVSSLIVLAQNLLNK